MKSVSVVIPSIGRKSLPNAIDSALNQSFSPEKIIVVLSTIKVEKELRERYVNIPKVLFELNPGGSASSNRNVGIRLNPSDFVAFLDDDDEWHFNKLEKQMEWTSHEIISCRAEYIGYVNGIRPEKIFKNRVLESFYPSRVPMRRNFLLPVPTLLVDGIMAKNVLFDETLNEREDIWFLHQLEKAGCSFIQLAEVLATVNTRKPMSDRTVIPAADIGWFNRLEGEKKGLGVNFFWGVALRNRAFAGDFNGLLKLIIWYLRKKG